jgi:uncharacterized Ntn-hydrolase superfamily protein
VHRELGVECHTFTIIGHCARTGLLGVALASSPLAVAARCVFIRANAGAVSTQAYAHPGLGPVAIRLLEMDYAPEKVLKELRETDAYPEHRQIGVLDRHGNPGVYTGTRNMDWKGHIARKHFVAMGNYLVGEGVVTAMAEAFEHSGRDILEERLMRALETGQAAGGERGGQLSSALTVYGRDTYARTDLRVDMYDRPTGPGDDAVRELRRIFDVYRPLIPYYEERATNPLVPGWRDWLAAPRPAAGGGR